MRTVTHIKVGDAIDFGYDDYDILVHGVSNQSTAMETLTFLSRAATVTWTANSDLGLLQFAAGETVMFETPIQCSGFNLTEGNTNAVRVLYSLLHR